MRRMLIGLPVMLCSIACSTQQPPPFKAVVDNKVLMESVLDPNADIIWDSVKWITTAAGTEEFRPRTNEEWTAVKHAAITLTESGNLLMLVPRAQDAEEWMKASQALIESGQAALEAIEKKDADELFTVGGYIYNACTNCHAKYVPEIVDPTRNGN